MTVLYYVPTTGGGAPLTGTAALQAIQRVRVALDQANGLRDAAGNPTTKTMYKVARSGDADPRVDRDAETGHVTRIYNAVVLATSEVSGSVTSDEQVIVGDDGTMALELVDSDDDISDHLGKTVRGQAIPSRGSLVAEGQLPARVRAEKERGRAVEALERAMGIGGGR